MQNFGRLKYGKKFWNKKITQLDCITLCAFSYINGLNPAVLLEWLRLISVIRSGDDREKHIIYLFKSYDKGKYKGLYSWNIYTGRYETLDGSNCMEENLSKVYFSFINNSFKDRLL